MLAHDLRERWAGRTIAHGPPTSCTACTDPAGHPATPEAPAPNTLEVRLEEVMGAAAIARAEWNFAKSSSSSHLHLHSLNISHHHQTIKYPCVSIDIVALGFLAVQTLRAEGGGLGGAAARALPAFHHRHRLQRHGYLIV